MAGRPAIFFDRDGTINLDRGFTVRVEDLAFADHAVAALKLALERGFFPIVVTNQSGVARGYYSLDDVRRFHAHMIRALDRQGVRIDENQFYVCPHHPEEGKGEYLLDCSCRKPKPGLLLEAKRAHDLELSKSYMVGDRMTDVETAWNAGCRGAVLLSPNKSNVSLGTGPAPSFVAKDLLEAVQYIVRDFQGEIDD